jgi:ribosomal-protein-alanine N-acetyltransferase
VHTIGVDPAWQGQGVGSALLRTLLAVADERSAPVFLEVRTDNEQAIRMYEAYGFVRLGLRKRYYQPANADAYTMGRPPSTSEGFSS